MDNDVPWYVSLILSWLPFLFLIGLMVWMTLTLRAALRSVAQAVDDHARGLRRANELFEESTKRRPDALEQKS